ncbi:serine hydrolase domain-containing protein [Fulvivirga kasyanovii]|uniref:Class A beta-lactamase-related serine hydrolase n=1 Tax=Fulvivirga kasyanovii TaxID=396812 RepID=A0ABW9RTM8_9BACT|nr:serine hydrolase domain-containing protein [Fulvivirga kasyanovii]MTI27175.1 class A beta-lactamase-related serine hydrolase [Fulvivirga kasyanovii]
MKSTLLFVAFFALLCSCGKPEGTSQTRENDQNTLKLDSLFDLLYENDKFMGSASIQHHGVNVYSKVIGFDDIELQKASGAKTKYRVGSISKMFTATLVFKAIEENKLNLDQTIEVYFPTIENSELITVGNLLNHRSGIHSFTKDSLFLAYRTQYKSPQEMVEIIAAYESDFIPDSKAAYSNSNYLLLSVMLEKIYNSTFKDLIEEKICLPLGLKDTYYGGKTNLNDNESSSYTYSTQWVKETETDMSIPLGAGAMVSTPDDLNRFMEALFGGRLVSKQSLAMMTTIQDTYGMGILLFDYGDRSAFGHGGNLDGFNAITIYFPKEELAIAVAANALNYNMNSLVQDVVKCYFNESFTLPDFGVAEISSEDLEKYIGIYTSEELPGKFKVTKTDNVLHIQLEEGPNDPLLYKGSHRFINEEIGVEFVFKPERNELGLVQSGVKDTYVFTKE